MAIVIRPGRGGRVTITEALWPGAGAEVGAEDVQEQVEVEVQHPLYAGPLSMAVADPLVAHHLLHPGVPGPVEVLGLVPEGASSTTNRL